MRSLYNLRSYYSFCLFLLFISQTLEVLTNYQFTVSILRSILSIRSVRRVSADSKYFIMSVKFSEICASVQKCVFSIWYMMDSIFSWLILVNSSFILDIISINYKFKCSILDEYNLLLGSFRMKPESQNEVPKLKLGQDVINMYRNYRNPQTSWKKYTLANVVFNLPDYYKPVSLIGSGAYGAVAIAYDNRIPEEKRQENMVAIKKMTNAFEHKIYARRVLRELKLLRLLNHPNIVQVKTIILPKSRQQFEDIYVVFEVMDSDIFSVIKKGDEELTEAHYQYFIYQILRGLMYIHSGGVIHRDLKTRNLLINSDCNIKICDFGLARLTAKSQKAEVMTDYVATRWYRAPQLLLGQTSYTSAVDMWSVGCILAELILKKPFLPASSTKQQLQLICETVETPDLDSLKNKNGNYYSVIADILKKKKKKKPSLIDEKIKNVEENAIDLLKKMLAFEPSKRISAKEAINHPFLADFRQPQLETTREPINPLEFEFENHNLTTEQLKDLIYQEILLYHFPTFEKLYSDKIKNKISVLSSILKNSNSTNINPSADADDEDD